MQQNLYQVCKGHKVKNVKSGDLIRHYYSEEILPEDYVPPKSYIEQKIVKLIEPIKKGGNKWQLADKEM